MDNKQKDELKLEYEKIMMDYCITPYSQKQMKITEFVDKLIGMLEGKKPKYLFDYKKLSPYEKRFMKDFWNKWKFSWKRKEKI